MINRKIRTRWKNPPDFVMQNIFDLHVERCARYMTRIDLQEATGVSNKLLGHYENARCWPKMESYNRLARFFGWQLWVK